MNRFLATDEDKVRYRKAGLWGDRSLYDHFRASAARFPGKEAIVQGERRLTYGEALDTVDRLSTAFAGLGVRAGDVVALQCPSRPDIPLVHFALNRIGALLLPLHEAWRETETEHLLSVSQAKVFICPDQYRGYAHYEMGREIQKRLPWLEHLVVLGDEPPTGALSLSDLMKSPAGEAPQGPLDADAPALIMVSSGTTALPKASLWSVNNLVAFLAHQYRQCIELSEEDVGLQIAPASMGSTGYVFPVLAPLLIGATSVMMERFDPDEALQLIEREHATFATAVPAQIIKMVDSPRVRAGGFSRFTRFNNAGAPLPYEAGVAVEELMGCRTQVSYGSTDGGVPSMTSIRDPQERRLRTVGQVLPGQEMMAVDDEFRQVPGGQSGEVTWRGANMSWGYLNEPERTAETFRQDGWYLSGDLGVIDDEGYLRIVGRKKEVILRGGHNISPRLIEDLLGNHPEVADVAVAAMPDRVLGERACAFVVLKRPGRTLTLEEATTFLKEQKISVLDLPERLEIVDDLPKSAGGKVQKAELTRMVTGKLRAEGRA